MRFLIHWGRRSARYARACTQACRSGAPLRSAPEPPRHQPHQRPGRPPSERTATVGLTAAGFAIEQQARSKAGVILRVSAVKPPRK
jgi:ferric-dicitrate binding protein FerR (iron transport regulator)